jgi:HK97 family phage prohead protease
MIRRAASVSVSGAIEHRLYGSINRIAWRPEDVSAVVARFGGKEGERPPTSFSRHYEAKAAAPVVAEKASADGDRTFTFTISSASVDRMGDSIAVSGWKLENYKRNPIVLWSHDGSMLPVGRATSIWVQGGRLKAKANLAPAEVSQYAERVRQMILGGFLTATSVGFAPLKYAFSEDPGRKYGIDFLEQELLEFSIVTVPANPDALLDAGQLDTKAAQARRARDLDLIRIRGGL